jgi:hypothetical protein
MCFRLRLLLADRHGRAALQITVAGAGQAAIAAAGSRFDGSLFAGDAPDWLESLTEWNRRRRLARRGSRSAGAVPVRRRAEIVIGGTPALQDLQS